MCARRFGGRETVCLTTSLPGFAKIDQFAEEGDALQQGAVADDEHAFTRTGQRHVEFAVDPLSALVFKLRAAEEGQLRSAADGETVDDGVALRTLENVRRCRWSLRLVRDEAIAGGHCAPKRSAGDRAR